MSQKIYTNMKTHFLHFRAKSGASIHDRKQHQKNPIGLWGFQFGKNNIYIKDYLFEENGVFLFGGLDIFVKFDAKDFESAKMGAKNIIESLLMLLSFTSLSYIDRAVIKSIFLLEKNNKGVYPVNFIDFNLEPQEQKSLTKIDTDNFNIVWKAFDKYSRKDRLLRSISWLRKGFDSKNIDQFICFVTGLEVLKKLLEEKLLEEEPAKQNFWTKIFSKKKYPSWSGVQKVFEDYLQSNQFKKVKTKRNQILHGYEKLDEKMIKEINSLLPLTRKALIFAIAILLDLPENLRNGIASQKWTKFNFDRWQIVGGHFKDVDKDLIRLIPDYPTVSVNVKPSPKEIKSDGEITINESCVYNFLIPKEFSFTTEWHEIWAENDSGISNVATHKIDINPNSD